MNHPTRLSLALSTILLCGAARAQDPAKEAEALKARVAAGTLAEERLEVAALLGHEPAAMALGRAPKRAALARCGHEASVRLAHAGARAALVRWGGDAPELLERALAAVEAWVGCPCAEHAAACSKLEPEVQAFTETLFVVDFEAPDAGEKVDAMEGRMPIVLAVDLALLAVRAPVEQGPGTPAPASEVALDVVGQAGQAEACVRRADAPEPTQAAARLLAEGLAGGGHGRPSKETREAGAADLERWMREVALFERAAVDRVLVEVRAAYLPWLLR